MTILLDNNEQTRPVGRPRNPTDLEGVHKKELLEWLKMSTRIRKLLESQLAHFERQFLNKEAITLSVDGQLAIMDGLAKLLTTSTRVVESGMKSLEKGGPRPDDEDPEAIVAGLSGGRG